MRPHLQRFIVTLAIGLGQPASAQLPGRPVHVVCTNATLNQALEQFAAQSGKTILVEGIPQRGSASFQLDETNNAALLKIASAFGYRSMTAAKSGVLLLTKDYSVETAQPEFVTAELHASVQEMLNAIRLFIKSTPPNAAMADLFGKLIQKLSPQQSIEIHSGLGLRVSSLDRSLQEEAAQIIWLEELGGIYRNWDQLGRLLSALPSSRISASGDWTAIQFPNSSLEERLLWHKNQDLAQPIALDAESGISPMPPKRTASDSQQTIAQIATALSRTFNVQIEVAPELQARHASLILGEIDKSKDEVAANVLYALAEMHRWSLTETLKDGI